MNTLINKFDSIEQMIIDNNLKIVDLKFFAPLKIMVVILNIGSTIQQSFAMFPLLIEASEKHLNDFTIIANGTGIHWNTLDEDISLKGLLKNHLQQSVLGAISNTSAA